MRLYIVDGSNAVRRGDYDPRFPEMDEARHEEFLDRVTRAAEPLDGGILIQIFFDGPRRETFPVDTPVQVRFAFDGDADAGILDAVRYRMQSGKGVVVVTQDRDLADQVKEEGAKVIRFSEFETRLRERRA
ncbi:MAG: hypothetical protein COB53_02260 [Elusimicrobia bacterium]|nr:MAG: hypothetical protein COB53_02260 [Elusimicrobiota bacterium]